MADTAVLETPEQVDDIDPIFTPSKSDVEFKPSDDEARERAMAEVEAKAQAVKPEEAEPVEQEKVETKVETKVEPVTHQHLAGMRRRAIAHGATTQQIDSTSPADLDAWLEMKDAERKPQMEQQVKTEQPKAEDGYDFESNPLGLDDGMLKEFKRGREAEAKLKALEERVARTETVSQEAFFKARDQRLMGMISEVSSEIAKQFDQSTPEGANRYGEFLGMMGAIVANPQLASLPENVRVKRALKALDVDVSSKEAEKKVKLDAAKKEYDEGALGEPTSRKRTMTLVDEVAERMKKAGVGAPGKASPKGKWLDG